MTFRTRTPGETLIPPAARAGGRAAGANYILANLKQGLSVPDWALAWSGNWNCHGHDSSRIGPAGSLAAGRGATVGRVESESARAGPWQ